MSTYHADPKISRAAREEFEADIRGKIEHVRLDQPMTGYRPLLRHLKRQGVTIGERKLRQIIVKFELQVKPKKRYVNTTMSDRDLLRYPNLIDEMTIDGPNQVWASDITYIRIENGFVYLAVIIDLFSRKIVGWQISKRIDAKLTVDALKVAIARRIQAAESSIVPTKAANIYLTTTQACCLITTYISRARQKVIHTTTRGQSRS